MFVARRRYINALSQLREQRSLREAAERQNKVLEVNLDWLRAQYNQAQIERSALFQRVTGLSLPTMAIERAKRGDMTPDFGAMPSFEDAGDEEAGRLGIRHAEDGTLQYTK